MLNSVARYYLTLQIEENRAKKLNRKKFLNRFDDALEENISTKDIHLLSSCMVEMHCTARDAYLNIYTRNKNFDLRWAIFLPKPFTVSMFQQFSIYFLIYMKRIKEQESIKIEKFERAFRKFDEVGEKLRGYAIEKENCYKKLEELDRLLKEWDDMIENQKDAYRLAVEECKKEEKLVDEMSVALEKLKTEVNKDAHDFNNLYSHQYELALKAIESLSEASFSELRSYRLPPNRLLAVANTLCIMFRQPVGWESAKKLLIRDSFFEDMVYYEKRNIPDDIFSALEQICAEPSFTPEKVEPISLAASHFCRWIRTVYEFAKFDRNFGYKTRELKDFEELYNQRLITLGEKRMNAEKTCQVLEKYVSVSIYKRKIFFST